MWRTSETVLERIANAPAHSVLRGMLRFFQILYRNPNYKGELLRCASAAPAQNQDGAAHLRAASMRLDSDRVFLGDRVHCIAPNRTRPIFITSIWRSFVKHLKHAVLPLMLLSSSAFAQSSVTLYGVIDEGIDYTSNSGGHHAFDLQSGYVQGSRWGLRGTEDLGGGLKTLFELENGFDLNSGKLGQGGRVFGRQAYVGLQSDRFGTVTLGRVYDSVVDFVAPMTAAGSWGGYAFGHPLDNDNTLNSFRINNAIKYTSGTYGGFSFGGLYAFSNQTSFANNRAYSFGAQYAGGPVVVGAAYLEADNPGATNVGALAGPLNTSSVDTNFSALRQRVWGAGISYKVAAAMLSFAYTHTDLASPTGTSYFGNFEVTPSSLKYDNFELNALYSFTSTFYLAAMYTYTMAKFNATNDNAKPKWHQVGLMADYNLSARTDVYTQAVYQKRAGDSTGVSAIDNAYIPGANGFSNTTHQFLFRVALRHKF
jgi:predicted porin